MVTIRDVAKRAGVAPMTVSRVINDSGYASEETRKRVEEAIAELNYVPNSLARSLRSNQTYTLALVVSDITNPFWTTVARGVEDAASEAGFNVMLCNTDENEEKQAQYLDMLLQKQVDGFLFVPARSSADPVKSIQGRNIPVVVLDRRVPGAEVDVIRGASVRGACEMVEYLLSLGHRRIAILSGPETVSVSRERVKGYKQALRAAGLQTDDDMVFYGPFTQQGGYDMTRRAMATDPQPTALFAANNFIAIGAMKALRELKLRVPEDISVAGFDALSSDLVLEPFLTAMVQPAYDMGRQATKMLLNRISSDAQSETQEVVLTPNLVVRQSCRRVADSSIATVSEHVTHA